MMAGQAIAGFLGSDQQTNQIHRDAVRAFPLTPARPRTCRRAQAPKGFNGLEALWVRAA
jgi:hypothetical protein